VNNLRDIVTDAKAGKRTLATRIGVRRTRAQYVLLLALAFAAPFLLARAATSWALLPLAALPLAIPPLRAVLRRTGAALNPALGATARLQIVYGMLLAIGLWR